MRDAATANRNGDVSYWFRELGGLPERLPALADSTAADVAIVGGGLTGLWAAYYLKRARPDLDVVILEREFCGFGASGRNGGYVTPRLYWPAGHAEAADRATMSGLSRDSVDEVWRVLEDEGVDAGQRRCGNLIVATNPAQHARLLKKGSSMGDYLDAAALRKRVNVAGALGGIVDIITFRVQPARLVRGLFDRVRAMGVRVYESTTVTEIRPRQVQTATGHTVDAQWVLRATEGFTASIKGLRRRLAPINSSMIVTEPLGDEVWQTIGWQGREMLDEAGHAVVYSQITDDGRIALGGRGTPYRFGSATDENGQANAKAAAELKGVLTRLFPATRSVRVEHLWCGVLGVPRNWRPSVGHDPSTGIGWAGGYTGNGVAAANMAGRTYADLVLKHDTPLARSPWVNRHSRNWEFEPLRFIGANVMYTAYSLADRHEAMSRSSRKSPIASLATLISRKP